MKNIRKVYPDCEREYDFSEPCDYMPLLESFGYKIVIYESEKDYQGDSWILYKDGIKFGYLQFGWGSCSGCDALQACDSYKKLEQLQKRLHNDIIWFDNAASALDWFNTHDWLGDYSGRTEECKLFIDRSTKYLQSKVYRDRFTTRQRMKELSNGN